MKTAFECLLLLTLIACAVLAPRAKKLLSAVILYTSFGLLLSVVWLLLEAPDLAITEAALGAGVTGILFFLTLQQINALKGTKNGEK
ncbi:MAG: DUF4040 domain-containing protein [Oscillospiraceae bacterium]|nr:DUF4040 domain-containing protein [Oscillospiraceae bacterium]MBR7150265.1 DUF4040 domain-containing protein [Oscillospiraceae bacterium]